MKLYKRMRQLFFTAIVKMQAAEVGRECRVNHFSHVTKRTYLAEHVNFNGMEIAGKGKVEIGKYFHSGSGCMIITSNHNYEGESIPYDGTHIVKDVKIGDFVWFGNRVIILPGVTVGEGAIIQAGAVVTGDIPACAIAGGNPAAVFKYRDVQHFERLKEEMKFR